MTEAKNMERVLVTIRSDQRAFIREVAERIGNSSETAALRYIIDQYQRQEAKRAEIRQLVDTPVPYGSD